MKQLYNRHRNFVEGVHGEAKTQHGLRRAVRRGLDNVAIQVYLTAAVMNLKRLATASIRPFHHCFYITKCLAANIYEALSSFGKKYPFLRRSSYGAA
jgi:Transposase DDE domain